MRDPVDLVDKWGPEKVVLVSDRRSGIRGVVVIDNTAFPVISDRLRANTARVLHDSVDHEFRHQPAELVPA